jgi:hypothetical protein
VVVTDLVHAGRRCDDEVAVASETQPKNEATRSNTQNIATKPIA